MNTKQKLQQEIKALALAMFFFGGWIATLVLLKQLLLAEYQIAFHGLLAATVGTLILVKVVLVVEHLSLGPWVRSRPAWMDVALRTAICGFGVVVVLLLEKGFEGRQEYGGVGPSLRAVFQHADIHRVWVDSICLTGALLSYNVLAVIRRHLGEGALVRMFLSPLPPESTR